MKYRERLRRILKMSKQQEANTGGKDADTAGSGDNDNADGSGDGAGNGNGSDNANGGDGGSAYADDGTRGGDGNNAGGSGDGWDGEFDAERAKKTITRQREEKRELERQLKEARAAKPADKPKEADKPNEPSADVLEMRKLREELLEDKRLAKFESLATGLRPEAIEMAYEAARKSFDISDSGQVTNMTDVVEKLRASQSFLFVETTKGQDKHGGSGGGTGGETREPVPTAELKAAAKAFGKTPAEYAALTARGGRPEPKKA